MNRNERLPYLSKLCKNIINEVKNQRPIDDVTLYNFRKTILYLIEDNTDIQVDGLDNLRYLINEYMRYGFKTDTDKLRINSYVKLSALIEMLDSYMNDYVTENYANQAAIAHPEYAETLQQIKQTNKSSSIHLFELEQQGFVIRQQILNKVDYILSQTGDELYRQLCLKDVYDFINQWSDTRILVLSNCLSILNKANLNIPIKDIVVILSRLSNSELKTLSDKINDIDYIKNFFKNN